MEYSWRELTPDPAAVGRLREELQLSELTARLLVNRGVTTTPEARRFLEPSFSDLHDPFLMKDMDRVVSRLLGAVDRGENILIYGDYDVDGITSTAVLKRALEMLGGKVGYYIPRRLEDGYGLKPEPLKEAARGGCRLVVSVDSGIRDLEAAACARELGLDLIITDHHLPGGELPPALAVLNPKRVDCPYPDKDLAAVGVVMKVVQALFGERGKSAVLPHFLKMVAIGTVADMVPLLGENRVLVKLGLAGLAEVRNHGLQALLNIAGLGTVVNGQDVAFKLAPRINAYTRMGGGSEVVDLFSAESPQAADAMVREMNRLNARRREEEERILAEIDASEPHPGPDRAFLVYSGRGWHRGVIGNVAARLVQRHFRPTLVLSVDGDGAQGSARSVPGFHLLDALEACGNHFSRFGGHAQAAGCSLHPQDGTMEDAVDRLRRSLEAYAQEHLSTAQLVPELTLDCRLPVAAASLQVVEEIERLGPFGVANPEPLFSSPGVVRAGPWVLKERHLKLQPEANGTPVDVIWWQHGRVAERLSAGSRFDMVYSLSVDTFSGQTRLLATVRDLRPA